MESLSHNWEMHPMILMGPFQHGLFYKLKGTWCELLGGVLSWGIVAGQRVGTG